MWDGQSGFIVFQIEVIPRFSGKEMRLGVRKKGAAFEQCAKLQRTPFEQGVAKGRKGGERRANGRGCDVVNPLAHAVWADVPTCFW